MYGKAAGIGTLPATGGIMFPEYLWYFIAIFAIIVAFGALWRIIPRKES